MHGHRGRHGRRREHAITVKTHPGLPQFPLPIQNCAVANGSGTVGNGDVNVAITCSLLVFRYLYVPNEGDDNVSGYSIDAGTGEPTALTQGPFDADVNPRFLAPTPRFAAGPPAAQPRSIAFNRRNSVLYVTHFTQGPPPTQTWLVTFGMDASTGSLTQIGQALSTNGATAPVVMHRSGRFLFQFNASTASFQRFVIDPATFAPTLAADVTTPTDPPFSFSLDLSGKYLYSVSQTSRTITAYRVDATTGALAFVNSQPTGATPWGPSPVGFQPQ